MTPGNRNLNGGSLLAGSAFLVIGMVWMLDNLGLITLKYFEWWPLILIGIGIIQIINIRDIRTFPGWFFIIMGSLFFMTENDLISAETIRKFWPLLLIISGLFIILNRGASKDKSKDDNIFNSVSGTAILTGFSKKLNSKAFRYGRVSAVFGGADIDLREAELGRNGANLELNAVFGGIELKIPENWDIELNSSVIFGGIENKSSNSSGTGNKILRIRASAVFGSIEIKN